MNRYDPDRVCILLATYNGQTFLSPMLESLRHQSMRNWYMYVRDDGSKDDTLRVLGEYIRQDSRIRCVAGPAGSLGAKENFSSLLSHASSARYVALADQDDVWHPEKLAMQMQCMREMESRFPSRPILVHSDMCVVDANLRVISPSFMRYQGISHEWNDPLPVLLAQNFVTGCTVLVNRALLEKALPIPPEALMHDWWLALCAAVFGEIGFVDRPLVQYRQHGGNAVGAKHPWHMLRERGLSACWTQWHNGADGLFASMEQARVLARRIREYDPRNRHVSRIEAYAALASMRPLDRLSALRCLGVHMQSRWRQALMLSRLLLTRREHA